MARKKKSNDGGGEGAPAWMATFSDLMNLLLCFFVLLFAMSSIDEEKFEDIAASFRQSFSIFDGGAASVTEGNLISSGISQLAELNDYYEQMGANPEGEENPDSLEAYEKQQYEKGLKESEGMAESIENALNLSGISDNVGIEVNSQYVKLTLNGALLFDSGSALIKESSYDFVNKMGDILKKYDKNEIHIVGHTDSVPVTGNGKYADNMELSSGRAYSVYKYLKDNKGMDQKTMRCTGRGEVEPVATNETETGRALNRRVEIMIYNEYSSQNK